jgi:DNA-binding CsgD family transcriptional regulator
MGSPIAARALVRLAAANTAPEVIDVALDEVPKMNGADAVGVYRFERGTIDVRSIGVSECAVSRYLALPAGSDPVLTRMQETCSPVHSGLLFSRRQWRAHPLYECVAGPFDFEHYLASPLIGRGEIIGALTLARTRRAPPFTERDLTTIAMTSGYLSVALAHTGRQLASIATSLCRLSVREQQIAVFVAKGLVNSEIAQQLGISESMVKKHLKLMFAKLGVSRRAELAWLVTAGGIA